MYIYIYIIVLPLPICPGGTVSSLESEVRNSNSGLQPLDLAPHGS